MKEAAKDYSPRAVVGIRPCDAKAMQLVRLNFDTPEVKDPYWLKAFDATTFIGMACDTPLSTCFCTSAGCGPYNAEGLDILMMDRGDSFLAKIFTEKGKAFADAAGWNQATPEAAEAFMAGKKVAEAKIVSTINTDNLAATDLLELHGASFWDDVAFACLNCGTCTFSCPTCWCFDIQDEVHGKSGVRMKNWDSCMFPIFTVHTTGPQPPGYQDPAGAPALHAQAQILCGKYQTGIMCVGCGRCVRQCPVNIDIRRVCEMMNRFKPADACAVQS